MTTLKKLLESKKCFKLVCGAGNENLSEVEKLVGLYYRAGCRFFDLSMSDEVLKTAQKVAPDAFFCISTGVSSDLHLQKAQINPKKCKKCGKCYEVCPQNALGDLSKCIGCMRCKKVCPHNAIKIIKVEKDLELILPRLKKYDCIELHCSSLDDKSTIKKWEFLLKEFDGFLSICIDRSKLSNERIIRRIRKMIKGRKPYTTIVQADGAPMSGGENNYKTTLQAVAMAEIIEKADLPVYVLLSGGTNAKSLELAQLCNVAINGVSVGSYARKIVQGLNDSDALAAATNLVNVCSS